MPAAPARQPLPAFDDLSDEAISAACEAGNLYRVDFMRAYDALRSHDITGDAA